jgi:hypothetical protein
MRVISTNGKVIKRYRHYGFKTESMIDRIMIKNNK